MVRPPSEWGMLVYLSFAGHAVAARTWFCKRQIGVARYMLGAVSVRQWGLLTQVERYNYTHVSYRSGTCLPTRASEERHSSLEV